MRFYSGILGTVVAVLLLLNSVPVAAQSRASIPIEPKLRKTSSLGTGTRAIVSLPALRFSGGSSLQVIAPKDWQGAAREVEKTLEKTHALYTKLFGDIPGFKSSVRLMDEETFFISTGAPKWTNAMYYKGQILLPLNKHDLKDIKGITRSVTHEYTHAVVNALSDGKCPGWFDEGIAQWAEGDENPALRPALLGWLRKRSPVPFQLLQGGFTRLEQKMVPPAYAQSLFAANAMMNRYGFDKIRRYFDFLRAGVDKKRAFLTAFNQTEAAFEYKLGKTLKKWAIKSRHNHQW